MNVERGIIKFFDRTKKFGFVTVLDDDGSPTKLELYLHYNNGFFVRMGDTEPEFRFKTGTVVDGKGVRNVDIPKKGTSIVFLRGKTVLADVEKVEKWAFAANYDSFGYVAPGPTMSPQ